MQFAQRKLSKITLAAAIAVGSLAVSPSRAAPGGSLFPEVLDATHATKASSAFFRSFFSAKSRHDVGATMSHDGVGRRHDFGHRPQGTCNTCARVGRWRMPPTWPRSERGEQRDASHWLQRPSDFGSTHAPKHITWSPGHWHVPLTQVFAPSVMMLPLLP
jgi:hypothetical protein